MNLEKTVALLVIGLVAGGCGGRPAVRSRSVPSLPTPKDIAVLSHVVAGYADANGKAAATNGQLVVTTMGAATAKLLGYEDPDDAQPLADPADPVFVVRVSGDFVGNKMPHPPDYVPPHGKYMYFVFEPQTRALRVFAISNRDEELSQVGTPQPFPVADS